MEMGQTVTDTHKRAWTLGQRLGRGLWGSSFLVRGPDDRELVLKVPHAAGDFPADAPVPDAVVEACAKACREQAALLKAAPHPFLPRLEAAFDLPDGRPALLLSRYPSSLRRKLDAAIGLSETLALAIAVAERAETLARSGRPHGDLRPTNVLLNERGEPVLCDVLTPALDDHWKRLGDLSEGRRDYLPPEAQGSPDQGFDTWAICLWIFEAAMRLPDGGDPRHEERLAPPAEGLDKMQLATLRDRALNRLKREGANPRFLGRAADRLASLLNRGITSFTEPSPPYRFDTVAELVPRLAEVAALAHPTVEHVGRLLLAATARDGVFHGGAEVQFSVTVGTTLGLVEHEHLACGVQITDLDAGDDESRIHVPDTRYSVQTHPSGRLRFQFDVPGLPPGRYKARVAFAVRDSGEEPQVAEEEFEVRPAPGYVPPAPEPEATTPSPIRLGERRKEIDDEDAPIPAPSESDVERASEADAFPTPIAPSSVGPAADAPRPTVVAARPTPVEVVHEPTVAEMPSMDAPPPPRASQPDADAERPTRPSDGAAPPMVAPAPSLRVPDTPTPHAPLREVTGPGEWEDELPGPEDDVDDAWVPGPADAEDLPDWEDAPREGTGGFDPGALVERLMDIARRDAYAVFLVLLAVALGLLAFVILIVRAVVPWLF